MTDYNLEQTWRKIQTQSNPPPPPPPTPQIKVAKMARFRFRTALIRPVLWNCDDHDDVSVSVLWTQDNQTNKQTQGQ